MQNLRTQLKISNQRFLSIIFAFSFLSFLFAGSVSAAELFFTADPNGVRVDEQSEIKLFVNTEDEDINALEGKIIFPSEFLDFQGIKDGASIISLWLERPRLAEAGVVVFSGIIPGGYNSAKGLILSLVFRAKEKTSVLIKTSDVKIFSNNGQGNLAFAKTPALNLKIYSPQPNSMVQPMAADNYLPEEFIPIIGRDENIFNNQWFLVFSTQDKDSGIDYYAVAERRSPAAADYSDLNWQKVESPYCLKDQALKSFIYVRAMDKAGNARMSALSPTHSLVWYEKYRLWIIIGLGMILAGAAGLILKRRNISRIN